MVNYVRAGTRFTRYQIDSQGFQMKLHKIRFFRNNADVNVECMFYDDEGTSFFLYAASLFESLLLAMSELPIFDVVNSTEGNIDEEMNKAEALSEYFEYHNISDLHNDGSDFNNYGIYKDALLVTLNVLRAYKENPDTESIEKQWALKDLKELDCTYHPF